MRAPGNLLSASLAASRRELFNRYEAPYTGASQTRGAAVRLRNRGQHNLAHDAGRRNPLVGLVIIAGSYGHGQIEAGKYKKPLTAITDCTPVVFKPRPVPPRPSRNGECEFAQIPLVAVLAGLVDIDHG